MIRAVLAFWVVASVALSGYLLAQHAPLPVPAPTDPRLRAALAEGAVPGRWRALHVMYRACTCSQRTLAYLLARPRPPDLDERVVIVDDRGLARPADEQLRARGFAVEVITPDALHARFGLEAAPVLVLARPDGAIAYVGGYSRHKQSDAYEDLAILAEARRDEPPAPRPVFGCATSARLARAIDPLGFGRW